MQNESKKSAQNSKSDSQKADPHQSKSGKFIDLSTNIHSSTRASWAGEAKGGCQTCQRQEEKGQGWLWLKSSGKIVREPSRTCPATKRSSESCTSQETSLIRRSYPWGGGGVSCLDLQDPEFDGRCGACWKKARISDAQDIPGNGWSPLLSQNIRCGRCSKVAQECVEEQLEDRQVQRQRSAEEAEEGRWGGWRRAGRKCSSRIQYDQQCARIEL